MLPSSTITSGLVGTGLRRCGAKLSFSRVHLTRHCGSCIPMDAVPNRRPHTKHVTGFVLGLSMAGLTGAFDTCAQNVWDNHGKKRLRRSFGPPVASDANVGLGDSMVKKKTLLNFLVRNNIIRSIRYKKKKKKCHCQRYLCVRCVCIVRTLYT